MSAPMNWTRVLLGGLAAGLVINVSESVLNLAVIAGPQNAMMARLGLPPMGGGAIGFYVVWAFLMGLGLTWLYAAARPRLGPGFGTAAKVGAVAWFFGPLTASIYLLQLGLMDTATTGTVLIWTLVEFVAATAAGGWLYREEATVTPPAEARTAAA